VPLAEDPFDHSIGSGNERVVGPLGRGQASSSAWRLAASAHHCRKRQKQQRGPAQDLAARLRGSGGATWLAPDTCHVGQPGFQARRRERGEFSIGRVSHDPETRVVPVGLRRGGRTARTATASGGQGSSGSTMRMFHQRSARAAAPPRCVKLAWATAAAPGGCAAAQKRLSAGSAEAVKLWLRSLEG